MELIECFHDHTKRGNVGSSLNIYTWDMIHFVLSVAKWTVRADIFSVSSTYLPKWVMESVVHLTFQQTGNGMLTIQLRKNSNIQKSGVAGVPSISNTIRTAGSYTPHMDNPQEGESFQKFIAKILKINGIKL